jgi:hypothetical protein
LRKRIELQRQKSSQELRKSTVKMNLMPSKISEPKRSEGGMENAHTADAKPKKGAQNGKQCVK